MKWSLKSAARSYAAFGNEAGAFNLYSLRTLVLSNFSRSAADSCGHIALDDRAGVRPSGILMRIIVGPHAVVHAPPGEHLAADQVVKKSRVNLLGEILARQLAHLDFFRVAMAFVSLCRTCPTRTASSPSSFSTETIFSLGITFEHTGKNHFEQRVFDFAGLLHADAVAFDAVAGLAVHAVAETGQDVQMHRQVEILRRRPEALIMIRGERQTSDAAPARSSCRRCPCFLAAFHLGDGVIDVVHGDQRDAEQTIRNFLAVIDDPVVVSSKQAFLQCGILDAEQAEPKLG